MTRSSTGELSDFDPEIERTFLNRRREIQQQQDSIEIDEVAMEEQQGEHHPPEVQNILGD